MRTFPRTLQPLCSGHSQKGILQHLIPRLCTGGHRGQAWLYLLILGVLCRSTWAYGVPETKDLQRCLENLTHLIEKSDAMLYAPSMDEIKENCDNLTLLCYMWELEMVFIEEQIQDDDTDCISSFTRELKSPEASIGRCPPCEATAQRNSTIFLDNLKTLLKKLLTEVSSPT